MIQIGIKYNNEVYLARASDCFPMPDAGYVLNNAGVWSPRYAKHTIMSFGGDGEQLNMLRFYKDFIKESDMKDGKLDPHFAYQNVYKPFVKILLDNRMVGDEEPFEKVGGTILIAKGSDLYHIDAYGLVRPIDNFIASEENFVQARAMLATLDPKLDPIYRILKVFDLIPHAEHQYPMVIKSTSNTKKTWVFNENQAKAYIKRYEKGSNK